MIYRATAGAAAAFVLLPCLLSAPPSEVPQFRLPGGVVPLRHSVEWTIDPRADSFHGHVDIEIRLERQREHFWVHAKDLQVSRVAVALPDRTMNADGSLEGDEFLKIVPAEPLPPGPVTLSIDFSGPLSDKNNLGFYRRKSGEDWYVFSTFPPIDARRALPCFDEPRFKTPWRVTLRVPATDEALSNGAVESETVARDGWKRVVFAETQPLAAELLGIAVGPFEAVAAGRTRAFATRGQSSQARAGAESAESILRALEQYTAQPYSFGKLDLLALPGLEYAAVETPGLVTFEERGLLLAPGKDKGQPHRAMEELLAHELAHQWFGNLVTQRSWRDVWLSEGAATWLSRKVLGRETLALEKRETLMREDEAGRARVVRQAVRSRAESRDAYNIVVYEKGAAVLMMLEGWLGESRLRDVLRQYLQEHRFANGSTGNLARLLPDPDAEAVLNLYLGSQGVPIVAGEIDCARPRPTLKIASTLSPVPVCWRTDTAAACNVVRTTATVELPEGSACPTWVHWNAGGSGYYRTMWRDAGTTAAAIPHLSVAEKMTLAWDLRATRSPGWRDLAETLLRDTSSPVSAAARDALR